MLPFSRVFIHESNRWKCPPPSDHSETILIDPFGSYSTWLSSFISLVASDPDDELWEEEEQVARVWPRCRGDKNSEKNGCWLWADAANSKIFTDPFKSFFFFIKNEDFYIERE